MHAVSASDAKLWHYWHQKTGPADFCPSSTGTLNECLHADALHGLGVKGICSSAGHAGPSWHQAKETDALRGCRDLSTALAGLQGQGPLVSLTLEVVNDRAASGSSASTSGREESIDGPSRGEQALCSHVRWAVSSRR